MMFLGIDKVKTKFGLVECMRLRPYMESGRVLKIMKELKYGLQMMKTEYQLK